MAKPGFDIFFWWFALNLRLASKIIVLSGKTAFLLQRKADKKMFKGASLGEQLAERRGAEYLKTAVAL